MMKLNRKWIVLLVLMLEIASAAAATGTIDIIADDGFDLFVDGTKVGSSKICCERGDSNICCEPQRFSIANPENVQVIAVKAWDTICVTSGLILSFRYGDFLLNTDSNWKCLSRSVESSWNQPGFNDR
ncbi:unnamed protein product [Owenia fusiformis]|uniref:Uncharacterized protein n=1 Tax=Owenia fusiformis TaxID=6347 RepID=A0A8S4PQH8_OWEFU|nr:unnamed protein product [Owenia fusiformis]